MANQNQEDKSQSDQSAHITTRREGPADGMIGGDVDIQVATAKRHPRSIGEAKQRAIELATFDQETAAACSYAVPRAGKIIEGPTVRCLEICAVAFGNMRVAAKTTGEDDGFVYSQSVAWDLENNYALSWETKRRITNKEGRRFSGDMIQTTSNAGTAIAMRNSIHRVLPRSFVKEVWLAARKAAAGSAKTLKQQRSEMIQYFEGQGIKKQQILDLLEIGKVDDINLERLSTLRSIAQSVKDGVVSIEKLFKHEEDIADEKGQAGDIAAEKERLLIMIRDELVGRWPGDSKESKGEKKDEVKVVFGCETWKEVSSLPNHILAAGLKCIRERANGEDFFGRDGSGAADDIPF